MEAFDLAVGLRAVGAGAFVVMPRSAQASRQAWDL